MLEGTQEDDEANVLFEDLDIANVKKVQEGEGRINIFVGTSIGNFLKVQHLLKQNYPVLVFHTRNLTSVPIHYDVKVQVVVQNNVVKDLTWNCNVPQDSQPLIQVEEVEVNSAPISTSVNLLSIPDVQINNQNSSVTFGSFNYVFKNLEVLLPKVITNVGTVKVLVVFNIKKVQITVDSS